MTGLQNFNQLMHSKTDGGRRIYRIYATVLVNLDKVLQ